MEWNNGLDEAKERGKKEHQEGGICRKKETHNYTFAKICTHRTGEAGLVSREEEKNISQQELRHLRRS
jgi:hypothetical protein